MKWDKEEIYLDADLYYQDLVLAINQAESLITIQMYIFSVDQIGRKIIQALAQAAHRGVEVRIIVDGLGSYRFNELLSEIKPWPHQLQYQYFHPLPFQTKFIKISWYQNLKAHLVHLLKINKRNHRKVITIDHDLIFSGTLNLSHVHSKLENPLRTPWKDIGIKFVGRELNQLLTWEFLRLWNKKLARKFRRKMSYRISPWPEVKINRGFYHRRKILKSFIQSIASSQNEIIIATAYFLPKMKILREIKNALQRKVPVKIILSEKSDVFYYHLLQYFWFFDLIQNGAKIYLYQPTILHTKIYMFDEIIQVGSSNLNTRSFTHDLEIDFLINEPESRKKIKEYLQALMSESKQVQLNELNNLTLFQRWLIRIFYLLRYWS